MMLRDATFFKTFLSVST